MKTVKIRRRHAVAALLFLPLLAAAPARANGAIDERAALHLLNRLGYGPKPGDVERVRGLGVRGYIDSQLAPAAAQVFEARLRDLRGPDTPAREEQLLRAIASPRQLEEVLTAFWLSWFGVAGGNADRLRPHVLGRYAALRSAAAPPAGLQGKPVPGEDDALRALAQQFVASPSAALVHSLERVWKATGGDQRAVLRALFTSGAFLAPAERGSMEKDALRFVVSAVRASGVAVENAAPLAAVLRRPMGARERADFARQLATGRLALGMAPPRPHRQASSAPPMRASTGEDPAQAMVAQPGPVLMEAPTPSARAMAAAARSQPADGERLLDLLLSDAFQRY